MVGIPAENPVGRHGPIIIGIYCRQTYKNIQFQITIDNTNYMMYANNVLDAWIQERKNAKARVSGS